MLSIPGLFSHLGTARAAAGFYERSLVSAVLQTPRIRIMGALSDS
jgi:hypothetical protein